LECFSKIGQAENVLLASTMWFLVWHHHDCQEVDCCKGVVEAAFHNSHMYQLAMLLSIVSDDGSRSWIISFWLSVPYF